MQVHPLRKFREGQQPPLKQEDLARMLGVSKATISRWEAGERFPDRDSWPLLKEITGLGSDELAAWSPPAPSSVEAA